MFIILASKVCIKVLIMFIKIPEEKENSLVFELYAYADQDSQSSCKLWNNFTFPLLYGLLFIFISRDFLFLFPCQSNLQSHCNVANRTTLEARQFS